jgi:hypothetical protein
MSSSRNTSTKPMPRNIRVKPSPNRMALSVIYTSQIGAR